jgi:hypothetical protein
VKRTTQRKQNGTKANPTGQVRPVRSLYDIIHDFFERYRQALFVVSMILSVLMSVFMFDVKVSLNGDDSDYLIAADGFWRNFSYPGGHGILYPIVISPLVGIFGMNLILIKSLSAVFIILSVWLFYKSFCDKAPAVVLMPAMLLFSICSYVFYYAGQTFSEPLFMFFQGLLIYFFSKYFLGNDDVSYRLKTDWRKYLILAAFALGMTLTRTIGYGVVGAIILFFAIKQRWRDLFYTLSAFVLVFGLFQIFKTIAWPGIGEAQSLTAYMTKDAYNPNLGYEDFPGLVKRFIENSKSYIAVFLYQFMGLIPSTISYDILQYSLLRTILIYFLYAVSLVVLFRRNKALMFVGLYAGVMCFFSFVILHAFWKQDRIIVVYYPFILLFLLGGVCFLFQLKALRKFFFVYPLLFLSVGVCTFLITKEKMEQNLPVLQQNILGDRLYGLTPDQENFIKACQWATKNLDSDARIVSRKPTISKVYTGRDFVGIGSVPTVPVDTLDYFKDIPDGYTILCADISKKALRGEALQYVTIILDKNKAGATGIYALSDSTLENAIKLLAENEIRYTLDYNDFVNSCKNAQDIRVYDPDMLLRHLKDMNVNYLLLPKLRTDTRRNTGVYINTIHNFVQYISLKYQDLFRTVHTVGNEESCEIMEFIY